jgi:hypothetical protein
MRFFLLSLCLSLLSVTTQAQSLTARADSLYKIKEYAASAPLYIRGAALAEFRGRKASNYYNAACCYALTGEKDSAFFYLELAKENGYNNKTHIVQDSDLGILHNDKRWKPFTRSVKEQQTWTNNPLKAQLVTTDVANFWEGYDLAQKDTANRLAIYRKYYIERGSPGLHDYFGMKVGNMRSFLIGHDRRARFYDAIRKNTLQVEKQKPQMVQSLVKFKELYPAARFPNVYFVIGNYTSGGTASNNGLLIGVDQQVKTADVPLDELNLWEKNNFVELEKLPHIVAHELIHFNQFNLAQDTTLLSSVLREGMADFLGELMSGKTANDRLHVWIKGKEKAIWQEFKQEMWLNRSSNWIANAVQETAERPADLGYWIGYAICKAYYLNAADKKQAVADILNIKDYKAFYEKSGADQMFDSSSALLSR